MRKARNNIVRSAFTLLEVLVATFILLIMVLILSKVFHQASIAWSAGFRRAEGNMTGRSAVSFMAREIMNAIADEEKIFKAADGTGIWDAQESIRFITLSGEAEAGERVARWITYQHSNGDLRRIEKRSKPNDGYGEWDDYSDETMVTNVESIFFFTPGGTDYFRGELPEWVRIRLSLKRSDDVSGVGASSAGPDSSYGTDDDVRSW